MCSASILTSVIFALFLLFPSKYYKRKYAEITQRLFISQHWLLNRLSVFIFFLLATHLYIFLSLSAPPNAADPAPARGGPFPLVAVGRWPGAKDAGDLAGSFGYNEGGGIKGCYI